MSNNEIVETLKSYLPAIIIGRIACQVSEVTEPTQEEFRGVFLFSDISGFTRLTEMLSERGPEGSEKLTEILNNYFGKLIDIVNSYGGDIVKFAGDSLIAVWTDSRSNEESLSDLKLKVAKCSIKIQQTLNLYEIEGTILNLKISIGSGNFMLTNVGGVFGRWEFIITGEALTQVGHGQKYAQPGDIIISPDVMDENFKEYTKYELIEEGFAKLKEIDFNLLDLPIIYPNISEKTEAETARAREINLLAN